jgi:hypothetical protein
VTIDSAVRPGTTTLHTLRFRWKIHYVPSRIRGGTKVWKSYWGTPISRSSRFGGIIIKSWQNDSEMKRIYVKRGLRSASPLHKGREAVGCTGCNRSYTPRSWKFLKTWSIIKRKLTLLICEIWDLRFLQRWLWRMSSSGMWSCVDHVWTNVSEERMASIFRVENPRARNQHGCFYTEDGCDTFVRSFGSHKIYTAPHPRRRHSSCEIWVHLHIPSLE